MSKTELENKVLYLYDLYWCGYAAMGLQDSPDAIKTKTELEEALSELDVVTARERERRMA